MSVFVMVCVPTARGAAAAGVEAARSAEARPGTSGEARRRRRKAGRQRKPSRCGERSSRLRCAAPRRGMEGGCVPRVKLRPGACTPNPGWRGACAPGDNPVPSPGVPCLLRRRCALGREGCSPDQAAPGTAPGSPSGELRVRAGCPALRRGERHPRGRLRPRGGEAAPGRPASPL